MQHSAFVEAAAGLRRDKACLPYALDHDGRHVKMAVLSDTWEGDHTYIYIYIYSERERGREERERERDIYIERERE